MSMSVVPRPFHNCRAFPNADLVTIDGTPLPLAEISRRRSVIFAALDLDMGTPSAGQILSQLLLPVYGRSRQGSTSACLDDDADASTNTTEDLHELLLCCDVFIIIIAKESIHKCRELQRELVVAGESLGTSYGSPSATDGAAQGCSPLRDSSTLNGAHLLPGCIAIVHDEGAEILRSLQLVGLDLRTVPAVFKVASNEQLQLQCHQADRAALTGELALHYRQFGLAHAGVQHLLEHQLLVERAATERLAQSLLATVDRHVVKFKCLGQPSLPNADGEPQAATVLSGPAPTTPITPSRSVDIMPSAIVEHIMLQLLHACENPGAV